MSLETPFHKFSFVARPVRLNKWSSKYMHAWHIYSYTWQGAPLFKSPELPRMTHTCRKTLSGHFQVLTDNWMGWWQASSSRTRSKAGPSYKSKEKFLPLLSPSRCIRAAVDMWEEEKGKLLFYYSNNVWVINPRVRWWWRCLKYL